MGNNIIVRTTPKNRISINTGKVSTSSGASSINQLRDVDASDADNGETLVYDEASGKYIVKELPIINGGEF